MGIEEKPGCCQSISEPTLPLLAEEIVDEIIELEHRGEVNCQEFLGGKTFTCGIYVGKELEDREMHSALVLHGIRQPEAFRVGDERVGGPMADEKIGMNQRDQRGQRESSKIIPPPRIGFLDQFIHAARILIDEQLIKIPSLRGQAAEQVDRLVPFMLLLFFEDRLEKSPILLVLDVIHIVHEKDPLAVRLRLEEAFLAAVLVVTRRDEADNINRIIVAAERNQKLNLVANRRVNSRHKRRTGAIAETHKS